MLKGVKNLLNSWIVENGSSWKWPEKFKAGKLKIAKMFEI